MASAKRDNSNPVSLFPFLAVLLCTMGALVVLLVAMAHVSRKQAASRAEIDAPTPVVAVLDPEADKRSKQLREIKEYEKSLAQQREKVDSALQSEQLRLSSIESHIRKLEDHLKSLRLAVQEVMAEDAQHYDDHAQAERNLKQLEELIVDTQVEIDELKKERGKFKAYSLVPYKGKNGTRRMPIYIECVNDSVLLQPEGIELTAADFAPPLGVGNPLAEVLRATREYYLRDNPELVGDPDHQPYPLIVVRPSGINQYLLVREAIRSWDSDFGYEMIGEDWDLKFSPPNPQLAELQSRAREHARARRELLAKAAPSAYGGHRSGGISISDSSGSRTSPYNPNLLNGTRQKSDQGGSQDNIYQRRLASGRNPTFGTTGAAVPAVAGGNSRQSHQDSYAASRGQDGSSRSGSLRSISSQRRNDQPPSATLDEQQDRYALGQQTPGGRSSTSNPNQPQGNGSNSQSGGGTSGSNLTAQSSRGKDWAIDRQKPSDIAIRRNVQVIVRKDRVTILPGRQQPVSPDGTTPIGSTIALEGSTGLHIDDFVAKVRNQVQAWGMAGEGLYWRPVLILNVSADGRQRADDLVQLLAQSGVEVRYDRTAQRAQIGPATASPLSPAVGGNRATR